MTTALETIIPFGLSLVHVVSASSRSVLQLISVISTRRATPQEDWTRIMISAATKIFLAYATEDKTQVRKLHAKLRAAEFDPWLDEIDLLPGQDWQIEIPKAIQGSKMFIACLSKRSVLKQGYVQKEFRLALSSYAERPPGTTYLIPLRLDECAVPDMQIPELAINMRHIQWLDYWKRDGFERLVTAIRQERGDTEPGNVIDLADAIRRKGGSAKPSAPAARKRRATNLIRIEGDVSGGIVANNLSITRPKSPRMNYPAGSVGANLHKYNYLAYLITRYFEYRKADSSYGASRHARRFHPAEIHTSIQSRFKVKTYFVPEELWEKECLYVMQRIDRTILGKNNTHKGIRNYEPFEEFLSGQK